MPRLELLIAILLLSTFQLGGPETSAQEKDANKTRAAEKVVDNSLLPTGRRLTPAGKSIAFHGRPVDLKLSADGKLLFVKDRGDLRIIDSQSFELKQSIKSSGGASLFGLAVMADGTVLFSNSKNKLHGFQPDDKSNYSLAFSIDLENDSFPCGVKLSADETLAYVCQSKKNSVAVVDLEAKKLLKTIPVGVAPFDLSIDDRRIFVSNNGGRQAREGDKTAPSAKTPTVVDKRGIAATGTVSVIDIETGKVENEIEVGRQPSVLAETSGGIVVCNANDDSISFVDHEQQVRRLETKPDPKLPFGSMPSAALAIDKKLLVSLAGNNAIAVFELRNDEPTFKGLIPTGWYPAALASNEEFLFVANVKGEGARAKKRDTEKGMNSHDHLGSVQRIKLSDIDDDRKLAKWTAEVRNNSRVPQILRANVTAEINPNVKPVPIPKKLGHPSVFKHVIYVIKENRTFDQVFGDFKDEDFNGVRSEPKLCIFPEKVTPNHHALARRFGVLDNYYCNGVLSADGHSWATEGNVTPYLERAFGGFARSYTFGDDPITYSSSGFLWDRFLDSGLSFRNYGEMDYAKPPGNIKYQEIWKAYSNGKQLEFVQNIGIERVRKYSCRDYPGWNMQIPDVLRMDRFLKEFREFEENNGLPNLSIVYLPQDHLGGGITSRSHMADNDLALGRLVEAVSNSKYWKDTAIFVNEDDPQNGYDHIDGHRSICLLISAYSRPGLNHNFYNQTSVLRTILHIFGLTPLNQQDSSMPLMTECFQETPNAEPYKAIAANFPLNESPAAKSEQSAVERKWRSIVSRLPLERTGMKTETDEDNLNRFVWHEMKGWEVAYPEKWAGPHGKGLFKYGLSHSGDR